MREINEYIEISHNQLRKLSRLDYLSPAAIERRLRKYFIFLHNYGFYVVVAATILATALINMNVNLYGDDFIYSTFTTRDMKYFITAHIDHYNLTNGRAIVHLLATMFLGLDIRMWQILNSFMIGGLLYFGTKTILAQTKINISSNDSYYTALIFAISIAFFNIDMTRQSVYWLTGSFNYTYPILMLLIYWFVLSRYEEWKKFKLILPVMAFLSAATVEQVSLMVFGLTLMTVLELKFICREKLNRTLILSLFSATVGMLTVVLAPSVFVRASNEHAPVAGFLALLKYNIKNQGTTFLFSKVMMPYLLMSIMSALGIIWLYRAKNITKWRILDQGILFYGLNAALYWFWHIIFRNYVSGLFLLYIGGGLVLLLIYAALLGYRNSAIYNNSLPVLAAVLCFGSQAMMLISPVYGSRNLLPATVMLTLYSASIMPKLNKTAFPAILSMMICFFFDAPWLILLPVIALIIMFPKYKDIRQKYFGIKTAIAISYISITLVAALVMKKSIIGYATNAKIYNANLQLAQEYKGFKANGKLLQTKLPNLMYAWVMPYETQTSCYIPFYNLYIGVDNKTEIEWKER